MTPEQKQRAMQMLRRFSQTTPMTRTADNAAVAMAALLQDLVDAPEPEPFGYFKSEPFGWTDCAETDDGAIALYTAPSEPKPVARVTGYYAGYLSIATVDGRVLPAGTALYAAPPHQSEQHLEMVNTPAPSVPDWQGWAMRLIDFIEGAEVSSGVCCCGDDMARHASPINCGHSPVDMWDNCVKNLRAEFDKFVAAPTQPEPPADMARDAARYRWLRNPTTDPALVIDKRVGPSFWDYEYRAGDELDAAIDAAIEREKMKGGEA